MKQQLFVDLDRTLLDTNRFKQRLWSELGKRYGFDGEAASYLAYDDKIVDGHFTYGFERHLQAFIPHASQLQVMEEVRAALSDDDYLYNDAQECLKWVTPNRPVHILTFGQDPYQHFKFSFCTPLHNLPFTVVNEPKRDYIARQYPGATGWLIDDKPDQRLPKGFKEIWLQRQDKQAIWQKNDIIVVNSLIYVSEVL